MSRMSGVLLLFQHGLRMYWVLRCKVREDFLRRACGGVSNSSESSHVLRGDRWGLSRRSTDTGCHPFKKNCGDHPGCQWREHIGERIAMLISSNQTRANGWNTGWECQYTGSRTQPRALQWTLGVPEPRIYPVSNVSCTHNLRVNTVLQAQICTMPQKKYYTGSGNHISTRLHQATHPKSVPDHQQLQ